MVDCHIAIGVITRVRIRNSSTDPLWTAFSLLVTRQIWRYLTLPLTIALHRSPTHHCWPELMQYAHVDWLCQIVCQLFSGGYWNLSPFISFNNFIIGIALRKAYDRPVYSLSVLDRAISVCNCDFQMIGQPA
jgi:hypothetical protein